MKRATISDAPAILNTNDKAMWALGFNEAIDKLPKCKCGEPWVLNTVHRLSTPCWRAADPADGLGVKENGNG